MRVVRRRDIHIIGGLRRAAARVSVPSILPLSPPADFDRAVFDRLIADIGSDTAFEALALFLTETGQQLRRMDEMLAAGDRPRLKRDAHSLKSAAATLGFAGLSAAAKAFEAVAESLAASELRGLLSVLNRRFSDASRAAPQPPHDNDAARS